MKRIIISDTHIGSKYYKAEELHQFLCEVEYDELILAGDIIDFIRIPLFTTRALKIAEAIDFSKPIIYLVGNHDSPLSGLIGTEFSGIKFLGKYEFQEGGRRFRIEHGDSYDREYFIQSNIIMSFLSVAQSYIENWLEINLSDMFTYWKIKRRKLRRIWDILAWNDDVDVFICGHSHTPEAIIWVDESQEIRTYVNSGDWVSHQTFVEIIDGVIRLKKYEQNNINDTRNK
jgi:UDP-2,3-diacylglucosamine pyrophosphatase LpxH